MNTFWTTWKEWTTQLSRVGLSDGRIFYGDLQMRSQSESLILFAFDVNCDDAPSNNSKVVVHCKDKCCFTISFVIWTTSWLLHWIEQVPADRRHLDESYEQLGSALLSNVTARSALSFTNLFVCIFFNEVFTNGNSSVQNHKSGLRR